MTFKSDLAIGHEGEEKLLKLVPSLIRTNGFKHDFETAAGLRVELKYDSTTYTNLFIETVSNDEKNSPGGPIQSIYNKVDYFVYLFKRGDVYVFALTDLIFFLYQNKEKYPLKKVPNKFYNTWGQAIPIADLLHLNLSIEVLK